MYSLSGKKQLSHSHYVTKDYKRLNHPQQEIIKKILYVFTFYAGKVSKYAFKELHEKYFMEMISDIWTIAGKDKNFERNSLNWRSIQNIYYSKGRLKVLDFNQFLEILPSVSVYFQPELERQEAMKALLYFIHAIHDAVVIKELQHMRVISPEDQITEETRSFIFTLAPDLLKLYKLYFPEELNNKFKEKDYNYKSFEAYQEIMKDFEVYPKLVSASQLFFIFHQTMDAPSQLVYETQYSREVLQEYGQYFRFSKFIESFIPLSRVSLVKLKQVNDPQVEQWKIRQKETLKVLFEYMETVKTIKKRKSKFSQTRFSLIVYEEYPEEQNVKKFIINDKKHEELHSKLGFYELLGRIQL